MAASTSPEPVSAELEALVMRHAAEMDAGNMEAAKESMRAVMDFTLQEACADPSPEVIRGMMADKAIDAGDWETASNYYTEKLNESRAEGNANVRASGVSQELFHLAAIEFWQGHKQSAYELASEGIAAARTADWDFILVHTLEPFARIAVRTGHFEEAIQAADEGLRRLEERRSYDLMRAMLILTRCEGLLGMGFHAELRPTLDSAWELLQPLAVMGDASGILATFGKWWRLEAQWRIRHQNWIQAKRAWENSLHYLRRVAEQWDCENRRCNAGVTEVLSDFADAADNNGEEALATQLRFERWQVCRANPGLA